MDVRSAKKVNSFWTLRDYGFLLQGARGEFGFALGFAYIAWIWKCVSLKLYMNCVHISTAREGYPGKDSLAFYFTGGFGVERQLRLTIAVALHITKKRLLSLFLAIAHLLRDTGAPQSYSTLTPPNHQETFSPPWTHLISPSHPAGPHPVRRPLHFPNPPLKNQILLQKAAPPLPLPSDPIHHRPAHQNASSIPESHPIDLPQRPNNT